MILRKPRLRFHYAIALLGCAWLTNVQATDLATQRQLFQQTYHELEAGNFTGFANLPKDMRQYPLYPWLEYRYIDLKFADLTDAQILGFMARNPHSIMNDRLQKPLTQRFAERREWKSLLQLTPEDFDDTDVQCYRVQALSATGQQQAALSQGKTTWMSIEKGISSACQPVTQFLLKNGKLTTDDYWQRIMAALERNQTTLARQLAADLPADQQALVSLGVQLRKNPADTLASALQTKDSPQVRQLIGFGIKQLARKESTRAESVWLQAQQLFKFTAAQAGDVNSALGIQAALNLDSAAKARLAAIPAAHRSEDATLWLARMSAREGDWQTLQQAVADMQFASDRDAANWQYWEARALEASGNTQAAQTLYTKVAQLSSFYGFLAADRLGQAYNALNQAPVDRSQRMAGLQKVAAIQRAFEWFALGNRDQARKEWFRTLKAMDREGVLATAELAIRAGDPNLGIWTLSRAKEWEEVNLRFPLVHTDLVMTQARAQGIQPAWVMGVMRRESAFDAGAASGANAFGLMQLIVPTARHVGQRLGLTINNSNDFLHPETNVQLGSAYLSEMLQRFNGDYAQATAAYNAGPGRPPKWSPLRAIGADQWIESIPFTETREYVQAVMAYTTIYDYKLNGSKGQRLTERLQPIKPNEIITPTTPVPPQTTTPP